MNETFLLVGAVTMALGGEVMVHRLESIATRVWLTVGAGAVLLCLAWFWTPTSQNWGPRLLITAVVADSLFRRWREWRAHARGGDQDL